RLVHVLGGRQILLPVMAQHANPESLQVLPQRRAVLRDGALEAASIPGIESGDGLQDNGAILDAARQWPAMVEGVRVGEDTPAAYKAKVRHQASHAAQRGWAADRAAGIRTEGHRHQARGHCRSRTTRGTASETRQIPRIARRWPRQIEGGAAMRKLVGGKLTHEYGTGLVELASRGRVRIGNTLEAHFGMP